MPSIIPRIEVAVFEALERAVQDPDSPLHGVEVLFGPPTGPAPGEYIAVGASVDDDPFGSESSRNVQTFPVTNPTAIKEEFQLKILVDHLGAAETDPKPSYLRVGEMADAVEDALGEDVTFGSLVQHGLIVRRRSYAYREAKRRGARVQLDFAGVARRGVTST